MLSKDLYGFLLCFIAIHDAKPQLNHRYENAPRNFFNQHSYISWAIYQTTSVNVSKNKETKIFDNWFIDFDRTQIFAHFNQKCLNRIELRVQTMYMYVYVYKCRIQQFIYFVRLYNELTIYHSPYRMKYSVNFHSQLFESNIKLLSKELACKASLLNGVTAESFLNIANFSHDIYIQTLRYAHHRCQPVFQLKWNL